MTKKYFETARGRRPATFALDHQERLDAAYALLDCEAPKINRVADIRAAAVPLVADHRPEAAARRLAEAALDPEADIAALVAEAINEHARNLAWDSLSLQLPADDAEVAAREQKVDAILSLPVPKFDPFCGTTRQERRRFAVGPSGH